MWHAFFGWQFLPVTKTGNIADLRLSFQALLYEKQAFDKNSPLKR